MGQFLQSPTRGGKLTILNCLLWVVVAVGVVTKRPELTFPAFIACWPIAWLCLMPALGSRSSDAVVAACTMIGVNSFLWGYGISWVLSLIAAFRRRTGPESPMRGFEVIAPTATEPLHDSTDHPRDPRL